MLNILYYGVAAAHPCRRRTAKMVAEMKLLLAFSNCESQLAWRNVAWLIIILIHTKAEMKESRSWQ